MAFIEFLTEQLLTSSEKKGNKELGVGSWRLEFFLVKIKDYFSPILPMGYPH